MPMSGIWPYPGVTLVSDGHAALGAMLIRVAYAATWGQVDIRTWAAAWNHVWVCDPTTAGV